MPRIGEVEYDDAGYALMGGLYALAQPSLDGDTHPEIAREAECVHEIYRQFPGVKMSSPEGGREAEERGADSSGVGARLDPVASRQAREEGEAKVERGSDEDWRRRAVLAVRAVALEMPTFTADDIWQKVEKPREPRALGPIMRSAARSGVCEATGRSIQSQIPVHHQAPVREYRSLIYRGEPLPS